METFTTLEQLAGLKGTEKVSETCRSCEGSGMYPGPTSNIFPRWDGQEGPWCFTCRGRGAEEKLVSSIRSRIRRHHKRLEQQQTRQARYEEAVARRKAEEALAAKPLPTGRVEVAGEVLSVKEKVDRYGSSLKMLVKGEGWKVWGTVPKALGRVRQGQRVEFTATIEESYDDPHFGFFKRPAKAQITG